MIGPGISEKESPWGPSSSQALAAIDGSSLSAKDPKTILLVEDEAIVAIAEAMKIRKFGYAVVTANSGETAIELSSREVGIDLILMDINLGGGIDGPEAARRILMTRDVPIVFLTSHSEKEYVERVEEITRYGYVIKNSSDFVLESSIKMAFKLFEANEDIRKERDALRDSRDKAERYLNIATTVILFLDCSGNLVQVNDSACTMLGYDRTELIGNNWFDMFIPEKVRRQVHESFLKVMREEATPVAVSENPVLTKGGAERVIRWRHMLGRDGAGRITGVLNSGEDITERMLAEDAQKNFDERYHGIIKRMIDYIYTVYYRGGEIVRMAHNPACQAVTGYSAEEFMTDPYLWFEIVDPEDRDRVEEHTMRIPYMTAPDAIEYRIRRKDGALRWIKNTPVIHTDSSGILVSRDGVVIDITERKMAEQNVQRLLREKELLLREVNHRIKNNMASLASLLSLQANAAGETIVKEALVEAQGRVESMLVLYDRLYRREDCHSASSKEYFDELLSFIRSAICPAPELSLELSIDDILIDSEYLFPLGILANELITNALKYAFPQGRPGRVHVAFHALPDGECVLSVADNGIGLPEGITVGESTGMGLILIDELTRQLHGSVEVLSGPGTDIKVKFAIQERP